jgi:hypothetical protein
VRSQRKPTPKQNAVTPQLGKRKRGTPTGASNTPDEEDELSPDRPENVGSVEKSRRLVRSVSPVAEETEEAQDELSYIAEVPTTARRTPGLVAGFLDGSRASASPRLGASRRSKSTDIVPVTPGMQPHSSSKHSFVLSTTVENTASNASQAGDEEADELSPAQDNTATPRVVLRESIPNELPTDTQDGDIDELSPAQATAGASISPTTQDTHGEVTATPVPKKKAALSGLRHTAQTNNSGNTVTPAKRKLEVRKSKKLPREEEEEDRELADELSPETERTKPAQVKQALKKPAPAKQAPAKQAQTKQAPTKEVPPKEAPTKHARQMRESPASDEESEFNEEDTEPEQEAQEPEQEAQEPSPVLAKKRTSPKQAQRSKPPSDKPPRKRQKPLGPKLAISVLRMKGYGVRGITMADTTRTILEEAIDHRLSRMLEKMQTSQDSSHRKELRSEVNLVLSFKESLSEKLLDLQDANDVLTTNLKKQKIFKRENIELRKDILALQNSRQEIALEHDDVQAEFEAEKAKVEARNTLSANMFEIEAAIENGRKKAQQEKREHEGPDMPLSMLLESVGRGVGSLGGGLLTNVKSFNGALERAAGWLEGRA